MLSVDEFKKRKAEALERSPIKETIDCINQQISEIEKIEANSGAYFADMFSGMFGERT